MLNIEFPQYYKEPVGRWLVSEGLLDGPAKASERLGLYLAPAVTPTHIVFSLCREDDDVMVMALKLRRHPGDKSFVRKINILCSPS